MSKLSYVNKPATTKDVNTKQIINNLLSTVDQKQLQQNKPQQQQNQTQTQSPLKKKNSTILDDNSELEIRFKVLIQQQTAGLEEQFEIIKQENDTLKQQVNELKNEFAKVQLDLVKNQQELKEAQEFQSTLQNMTEKILKSSSESALHFQQQQNLVDQLVQQQPEIINNNQAFKTVVLSKIDQFHNKLNQQLTTSMEDLRIKLQEVGQQVQSNQSNILNTQQQFSLWFQQQQGKNDYNTSEQPAIYNTYQQQPQNSTLTYEQPALSNTYQQQPQNSTIMYDQRVPAPVSEVTKSKIKIVSQTGFPQQN